MKFKVDENLPAELAELLRSAGYEAVTVVAQGRKGDTDPSLTEVCRKEERILVTFSRTSST